MRPLARRRAAQPPMQFDPGSAAPASLFLAPSPFALDRPDPFADCGLLRQRYASVYDSLATEACSSSRRNAPCLQLAETRALHPGHGSLPAVVSHHWSQRAFNQNIHALVKVTRRRPLLDDAMPGKPWSFCFRVRQALGSRCQR
jgi:hypothetical protein